MNTSREPCGWVIDQDFVSSTPTEISLATLRAPPRSPSIKRIDVDYWRYRLDIRGYFPVNGLNLVLKGKIDLSRGKIPSHHYVVLNLREHSYGYCNRENLAIGSIEIHPPLSVRLGHLFRQNIYLFFDMGTVWHDTDSPRSKRVKLKYGFGFRFYLPRFRPLWIEYALNENH